MSGHETVVPSIDEDLQLYDRLHCAHVPGLVGRQAGERLNCVLFIVIALPNEKCQGNLPWHHLAGSHYFVV